MINLTPNLIEIIPARDKIQRPVNTDSFDLSQLFGGWKSTQSEFRKGSLNIKANEEQILAGTITTDATPSPTSSGIGIFFGKSGSSYQFRLGDYANNKYLLYDGTDVTLKGGALNAGTITSATITSATITSATITGGSLTLESGAVTYFSVSTTGVTALRYASGATNFVTTSGTTVTLAGAAGSTINFDAATTNITVLNIQRNTSASTTNVLATFVDSGTTSNSSDTVNITSASTGKALNISKTGAGNAINIAQSGDATGVQLTQTGNGWAFRIDMDYTASAVTAMVIDHTGAGTCLNLNAAGNGHHLLFTGDPTVASPVDGGMWFDGTNLKFCIGATTYNIDMTAA